MPERGDVWIADLNPPSGTEPGKARPALIVQAQALLDVEHRSTFVGPLTSRLVEGDETLPTRILVAGDLRRDAKILSNQSREIDNRRLVRGPITQAGGRLMTRVGEALLEVLDLAKD